MSLEKIFLSFVLVISLNTVASEEIFLSCDFDEYTDYISLKSPDYYNDKKFFSEGTWMRSSFGDTRSIRFKRHSSCTLHCVSSERYLIMGSQILYRNSLILVDNLLGSQGGDPVKSQCRINTREDWHNEVRAIGSENRI